MKTRSIDEILFETEENAIVGFLRDMNTELNRVGQKEFKIM